MLAHALIPSQRTTEAFEALRGAVETDDDLLVAPHILVEFTTALRKLEVRGSLTEHEVQNALADLSRLELRVLSRVDAYPRGMELATRLRQSDTFDSTGYAIAERLGAEFWVSDRRFANAAAAASLPGIRFIP